MTVLQLKKVINRVASELSDLGLTSEVLKDLLAEREPVVDSTAEPSGRRGSSSSPRRARSNTVRETSPSAGGDEDDKVEADVRVEAVEDEPWHSSEEEEEEAAAGLSARQRGKRRARQRRAKASYELAGERSRPSHWCPLPPLY